MPLIGTKTGPISAQNCPQSSRKNSSQHNRRQWRHVDWETWTELEKPDELDVNVIRGCSVQTEDLRHVIEKYASYYSNKTRLQRIIGWCLRFVYNVRLEVQRLQMRSGELVVDELAEF